MTAIAQLAEKLHARFADTARSIHADHGEICLDLDAQQVLAVCRALRDETDFRFECLMDLCGVDYSELGDAEWKTDDATDTGFSRGVERSHPETRLPAQCGTRFAVAYQLLSVSLNHRLRVRAFIADDDFPALDSVTSLWRSADWYEREAFDLFGIMFNGHPDLRRILTDYGFIGHPFRKDFPLIGQVEVRYDPEKQRVIYQPVSIEPRVLVPRVIRADHRYVGRQSEGTSSDA